MMKPRKGENPEGKYIWYDEVVHSDEAEPKYQLNPITKQQDALIHRRRLELLKELVEEDSAAKGKGMPGKA